LVPTRKIPKSEKGHGGKGGALFPEALKEERRSNGHFGKESATEAMEEGGGGKRTEGTIRRRMEDRKDLIPRFRGRKGGRRVVPGETVPNVGGRGGEREFGGVGRELVTLRQRQPKFVKKWKRAFTRGVDRRGPIGGHRTVVHQVIIGRREKGDSWGGPANNKGK